MLVFPTLADIHRALPHVDPALIGNDLAYPAMLTLLPVGHERTYRRRRSSPRIGRRWRRISTGARRISIIDFYQRFVARGQERATLPVGLARADRVPDDRARAFTLLLSTASEAFQLLLSVGAGTGLIYLLRWFWWRINAWSEISAMVSSFVISLGFFVGEEDRARRFPIRCPLLMTVAVTTVVWVTVTLLTSPADHATLVRFYELTRPAGPGWNAIRAESKLAAVARQLSADAARLDRRESCSSMRDCSVPGV